MTETPENIRYTADVVCLRGNDVLLIERRWDPHAGLLALPGGHVDAGETSRAAAARELLEETGVRVDADDLELLGVWDAPDRDPRGWYVTAAYLARVATGTQAHADDDAASTHWVPLTERDHLRNLAFDHGEIVYAASRRENAAAQVHATLALAAATEAAFEEVDRG